MASDQLAAAVVDWSKPECEAALKSVPPRFHALARQYVESVGARVLLNYPRPGSEQSNALSTTLGSALNGLTLLRWYLLSTPARIEHAAAVWGAEGLFGLCAVMREFHQQERVMLVNAYGSPKQEGVAERLSALHASHKFTLIATTHGYIATRVQAWADGIGIPYLHFPLSTEAGLVSNLPGHYYALLDKLQPRAVCVLSPEANAMRLANFAVGKGVPVIDVPKGMQVQREKPPTPQVSLLGEDDAVPREVKAYSYSNLMKAAGTEAT